VDGGARDLIVPTRRGLTDEESKALVAEWDINGVCIIAPCCGVMDNDMLDKVISLALTTMPPVRVCIRASAVLCVSCFPAIISISLFLFVPT
jgi:hypothetical protein